MDSIKLNLINTNNSQINKTEQDVSAFEDDNVFTAAEKTKIDSGTPYIDGNEIIIFQPITDEEDSDEIKTWDDIMEYAENAESAKDVEKKVIDTLAEKKDKPEDLKTLIDSMLAGITEHYDSERTKTGIAGTNAEKLMKHLTESGDIEGSICLTEHGLVSDLLNEAGIPATVISGTCKKNGHATLLYQNSNGQFIWNDYGNSFELPDNISSLKDAIKYITKESSNTASEIGSQMHFIDSGLMGMYNHDSYFKRVLFDEEAAFGEKLDKTATDTKSMLDKTEFDNENSIAIEQNGKMTFTKSKFENNKNSQITISGKTQENGETAAFYNSESTGVDVDYVQKFQKDKKSLTLDNNITFSHIDNKDSYQLNYLMADSSVTGVKNILDKDGTTVDLFGGAGVHAIATQTFGKILPTDADGRIYNEIGAQAGKTTEKNEISALASVGMPLDFSLKEYTQTIGGITLTPGFSIKTSTTLKHNVNPNLSLLADGNFNYTQTKHLNHTNFGANLGVKYNNDGTTLAANVGVNHDQEHLSMDLFEEDLKNETELYTSVEYSPKENIELGGKISYELEDQKLKGSAGIKFRFQ